MWTMPSTSDFPGKLRRASSQAMAMPKGRLPATPTIATWRLRRIASHSASVSWNSTDYRKASRKENIGSLGPLQIGEERSGRVVIMPGDQSDRIDDRRMGGGGKSRCNAHLLADHGVSRIDDTSSCFAAFHEGHG